MPLPLKICEFIVAGATLLTLSACISTDYDISRQIDPVFPLPSGRYKTGEGKEILVSRDGNAYASKFSQNLTRVRLFRVPEFDKYIIQAWSDPEAGKRPLYTYGYAELTLPNKITVLDFNVSEGLPSYLKKLVEIRVSETLHDAPRDTLYFLREVGRQNISLKVFETLTLQ